MYNNLQSRKTSGIRTFAEVKKLVEACSPEKRCGLFSWDLIHLDNIVTILFAAKYCRQTIRAAVQVIDTDILSNMIAESAVEDIHRRFMAEERAKMHGN
jgi:hypothetical protein